MWIRKMKREKSNRIWLFIEEKKRKVNVMKMNWPIYAEAVGASVIIARKDGSVKNWNKLLIYWIYLESQNEKIVEFDIYLY